MTSTLRGGTLRLPATDPPAAGPLPILHGTQVRPGITGADAEMTAQIGYGQPYSLLPYTPQDGYTRARRERELPVVVLENSQLTATFLPGYGGRLWSLVHRGSGRELLHRNPILQPANLALRDAWLAGGVEWNLGATGHWPLTCSPLHAVRLTRADGTPMLRLYEFERMRRLLLQIDAWLPEDSPVLFVRVTIRNPAPAEAPVYWWSNIAVPEGPGVRVVAPADRAHHFDYTAELRVVGFPVLDGVDRSYTDEVPRSADYFFEIPRGERRWIAALDAEGRGLVQTSTDLLRGRKLFHWGTGPGGRRWQEWLSGPGSRYLEIQAGLARTQLEHVPMPGSTTWSWVEAYGLLEADPGRVHGSWDEARAEVSRALDLLVPREALERQDNDVSGQPVRLAHGSGWAALEAAAGALPELDGLPYGEMGEEQAPWAELLASGRLPVSDPPAAPVTGPRWRALLEAHPADWHARYHLGLARYADGDTEGARAAWAESLSLRRTPWTLRCLAESLRLRTAAARLAAEITAAGSGSAETAAAPGSEAGGAPSDVAELLVEAHALAPHVPELAVEALHALLAAGRPAEALALVDGLGAGQRSRGRIQLIETQAALDAGDLERAGRVLTTGIEVDNLREGEISLDAVWFAYQERRLAGDGPVTPELSERARREHPLPSRYDFRMQVSE
ncbi:DUF5107 domain-containing protein [Nonomuraea sp. NPDC050790]|uniref:DUF5107 domain-containing protein n=1 Tax=Nonomuraea sp. NPDC050790 TaxID=3364371 RepID=UPI0037B84F09